VTSESRQESNTEPRPSWAFCRPTGKRPYGSERVVTRAVNKARERGQMRPLRHYRCPHCEHWHLATKKTKETT
jgi:hypothetical protein